MILTFTLALEAEHETLSLGGEVLASIEVAVKRSSPQARAAWYEELAAAIQTAELRALEKESPKC